ncbi:MAG: glycine/betaine ABC transporter substrate-binding protein [Deltaproteobacteria bacterium]|nr:glycine/betaine ABC transporter substrate-binding protein [Deltaproteobacteria bacterium]MBW1920738.1 glycine/betaine ABC transporter substrate-binding protein [Deltaproteobacteria bacterium]
MKKGFRLLLACAAVTFAASICLPASGMSAEKRIIIGGKNFTEQYLLPELAKDLLEKAGFKVELKTGLATNLVRKALEQGEIDLYYEYTGTAYTVFYKQRDPEIMNDSIKVYNWVRDEDKNKGLIWLDPVQFNNTYTLMMQEGQARKKGIESISDLANYVNRHPKGLIFGIGTEFWERPDGFKKLMKVYGFSVPAEMIKKMSIGLAYTALKNGQIGIGMGFATDGRIAAFGFVNLVDDKKFFPVYNPVPVVRAEVLNRYPEIRNILKPLADNLNTIEMQEMNKRVDVDHESEEKVAKDWLRKKGLL